MPRDISTRNTPSLLQGWGAISIPLPEERLQSDKPGLVAAEFKIAAGTGFFLRKQGVNGVEFPYLGDDILHMGIEFTALFKVLADQHQDRLPFQAQQLIAQTDYRAVV